MIIFDKNSWHFKLINYIFTSEFFLETDGIDTKAMESVNMENDFNIIYKKKSKTVNLCPYCRAVVVGIISLPFVWIFRKFPHKKKKPLTHKQIMKNMQRRSLYFRCGAGGLNIVLGMGHLFTDQDYATGGIQIAIGVILILVFPLWYKIFKHLVPVVRPIIKFVQSLLPKKKQKEESVKIKNPSLIMTKLNAEHDKICPPIYFVDKSQQTEYT